MQFDVKLVERCRQKTVTGVTGTFDHFSGPEFIVNWLKDAKQRHWMQSRQSLRIAIETGDLFMPGWVDGFSNIMGAWLFFISYLIETRKRDNVESWCMAFSLVVPFITSYFENFLYFRRRAWTGTFTLPSWFEWSLACSNWLLKCDGLFIVFQNCLSSLCSSVLWRCSE